MHIHFIKGALCGFGEYIKTQNFNTHIMNEVIIQTQKYVFFLQLNKQAVFREK